MNVSQKFLQFAFDSGALHFGEFILNSGRASPYYLNTGGFSDGRGISMLSEFYAATIAHNIQGDFMLYGPAYKGIPLASATALSLHQNYGINAPFAFNRKEMKDHGDGGWTVGAPLQGRVVIVEDVITSGMSINAAVDIIRANSAEPHAVVISLDRMERAQNSGMSAIESVKKTHGMEVFPIASIYDLLNFAEQNEEFNQHLDSIKNYFNMYVTE